MLLVLTCRTMVSRIRIMPHSYSSVFMHIPIHLHHYNPGVFSSSLLVYSLFLFVSLICPAAYTSHTIRYSYSYSACGKRNDFFILVILKLFILLQFLVECSMQPQLCVCLLRIYSIVMMWNYGMKRTFYIAILIRNNFSIRPLQTIIFGFQITVSCK